MITTNIKDFGLNKNSKLLAIFPHPDDESAFAAGFLRKAKRAGVEIKFVCATKGEKSTKRNSLNKESKLDDVRHKELQDALRHLGIKELEYLGVIDGEIEQNIAPLTKKVEDLIRDFNPHFVLTLEPDGIYGHPDHIALTKVVTDMFNNSKKFKLIYATVDSDFYQPSEGSRKMAKDPDNIKPLKPNLVLKLALADSYKKLMALRAHQSQFQVNYKFIKKWHSRKLIRTEMFYLVNKD